MGVSHVAYCFDGAYALLTGVSLTSLLHHNPGPSLHIHCLVRDVDAVERERLRITAQRYGAALDFIDLEQGLLADLPLDGHLTSPLIYARLLLPRLLPASLERVLYLDSDTLVLGDIGALFRVDLADHPLAAVADVAHVPMGARLGLPPGTYFNAGVQLMNLSHWRQQTLGERCLDSLIQPGAGERFAALDQDALNAQVQGRYLALPDDYNLALHHKGEVTVLGHRLRSAPITAQTRIVQFLGRVKPHCDWYVGPGLTQFERYRSASEWHDVPLVPPRFVDDLVDWADKRCTEGRYTEAVALLRKGLLTLADRIVKETHP
ncbi:glycosyltransferase [Denitratisoma sp. agr-D3]